MSQSKESVDQKFIEMAKKALTPEQIEEYKRMGEYMYDTDIYKTVNAGSKIDETSDENTLAYAIEGLKAGLDPMDLSSNEVRILVDTYGEKWYEKFDYDENEVPKLPIQVMRQALQSKSRQERRAMIRRIQKNAKKEAKKNEKYL